MSNIMHMRCLYTASVIYCSIISNYSSTECLKLQNRGSYLFSVFFSVSYSSPWLNWTSYFAVDLKCYMRNFLLYHKNPIVYILSSKSIYSDWILCHYYTQFDLTLFSRSHHHILPPKQSTASNPLFNHFRVV